MKNPQKDEEKIKNRERGKSENALLALFLAFCRQLSSGFLPCSRRYLILWLSFFAFSLLFYSLRIFSGIFPEGFQWQIEWWSQDQHQKEVCQVTLPGSGISASGYPDILPAFHGWCVDALFYVWGNRYICALARWTKTLEDWWKKRYLRFSSAGQKTHHVQYSLRPLRGWRTPEQNASFVHNTKSKLPQIDPCMAMGLSRLLFLPFLNMDGQNYKKICNVRLSVIS